MREFEGDVGCLWFRESNCTGCYLSMKFWGSKRLAGGAEGCGNSISREGCSPCGVRGGLQDPELWRNSWVEGQSEAHTEHMITGTNVDGGDWLINQRRQVGRIWMGRRTSSVQHTAGARRWCALSDSCIRTERLLWVWRRGCTLPFPSLQSFREAPVRCASGWWGRSFPWPRSGKNRWLWGSQALQLFGGGLDKATDHEQPSRPACKAVTRVVTRRKGIRLKRSRN